MSQAGNVASYKEIEAFSACLQRSHFQMHVSYIRFEVLTAAVVVVVVVVVVVYLWAGVDRLLGIVGRLPGCRPRGPGFDSRRCQIF
jgi:hypothetical protein